MADRATPNELIDHLTILRAAVTRLSDLAQHDRGNLAPAEVASALQFRICLNLIDNLAWVVQGTISPETAGPAPKEPPQGMYR